MVYLNRATREMSVKIVYCGAGLSGKTTNLQYIYGQTNPVAKGEMIKLNNPETERTIYFDFLPLQMGEIRGHRVRFHLYTVPGQIFYDATRSIILKGADGIVFVVDSRVSRLDATLESWDNLHHHLRVLGLENRVPIVVQYNKRDMNNIMTVDEIRTLLGAQQYPQIEAAANGGRGVFETLRAIGKLALHSVREQSAIAA